MKAHKVPIPHAHRITVAVTDLSGIVLPDARSEEPVDLGCGPHLALLSVIRHRYRLPCQEHLVRVKEQKDRLEAVGAVALAVGFSPPDALAALADELEWPWPFLSEADRLLYVRLGLERAPRRAVYNPGTLNAYRRPRLGGRAS